jgi:hypothetical protein
MADADALFVQAGHFALEEKLDETAGLIRDLLGQRPPPVGVGQ